MVNKITSYQTAENGKFIEILNNTAYPAISVVRLSYPDTSDAFPENYGLSPVSSVDVYSKYAVLTHLTNPEDIKISLSAENINVSLDELEYLVARSNSLIEVLTASGDNTFQLSLLNALTANTDNIETLLDSLTSLQEIKQNDIITLLNQLTANTDSLEVNTDEVEFLLSSTNLFLNTLTAVDYATSYKQDSIITLLDALTAKQTTINLDVSAINLNTDEIEGLIERSNTLLDVLTAKDTVTDVTGIETRLDVLTAVDYASASKQDSIITLLDALTAKDTVTDVTGIETRLDVLTAVDYANASKQDSIITLLGALTAKQTTINLDVSAINLNTDEIEGLIKTSNTLLDVLTAKDTVTDITGIETRLDVLTAVDYANASKQDSIITLLDALTAKQTTINLDVSAINLNTDEIEGLIKRSNTLLDTLTAKQTLTDVTGIETRLDVLTAVDYASASKQDSIITLLDALTAKQTTINLDVSAINLNTDEIEGLIERSNTLLDVLTAKQTITDVIGIETRLDVLTAVDYATSYKQDQEISLLDSLTSINIRIPGFSIPPYDEISLNYYGLTNNIETVIYKNNTTTVLSLSLGYAPNPPTSNDALLSSVKKF